MESRARKQAKWRELNKLVIKFYENLTGIDRKDVRLLIKLGKETLEECEKDLKFLEKGRGSCLEGRLKRS